VGVRTSDEPIPADLEFYDYDTRLAAYAVIVDGDRVLLSWWNGEGHGEPGWSLPGGGVDLPETTEQGVLREVREETGFEVELTRLLAVDSHLVGPSQRLRETDRWLRSLRVLYTARVVGGSLGTLEVGGSTDYAEWVPIASMPDLPRAGIVDIALAAWRDAGQPAG
jgi:8-oxo-dGTP diphosphatase